ncbi:hypothetical protein tb265_15960 [Gemmatimonadetes bacterium T265]|nr:hypothetical protein tb265_15960 [Gemmatimonadetes bacterium T265]
MTAAPRAPAGAPAISVVVPSYNRRHTLEMVLGGLAAQRGVPPDAFEVLVVLDGSTDGSDAMLAAWQRGGRLPRLRWESRANGGQAAARDAGARAAAAPLLLFLDDDVVPEPDLVARHLAGHPPGARVAVLGDCEIVREAAHPFYTQQMWSWWEDLYTARARPGRAPCYVDFCAGNVSLRREDYLVSGGFDPAFRGYGGEDYDLGYRLLRAGVRFVADRRAHAMHHHRFTSYATFFRTRRQEGSADVLLGRKHPELRAGIRAATPEPDDPDERRILHAAFAPVELSARVRRANAAWLALDERLRRRVRWKRRLDRMGAYYYWRGVYDVLGSLDALDAFRREATLPVQHVDVRGGLGAAPDGFWVHGPSEIAVTAGGRPLGTVRLPGPVMRPLREALADVIGHGLVVPILLEAERAGTSLFTPGPSRV